MYHFKKYILPFLLLAIFSCSGGGGGGGENTVSSTDEGQGSTANPIYYNSKILMELFTSTTCGPCLPQNSTLNRYLDPTSNVYTSDLADHWIVLRYHVWWPSSGDPYYDWNPNPIINRENYYDVGFVPHMYTNGNIDSGSSATVWRADARSVINNQTRFKIDIDGVRNAFNISGSVKVTSSVNVVDLGFKLFIAVTHDNSQYNAPNGQTVFDQTFIDFLSGSSNNGNIVYYDEINISAGETLTKNYNWTLDSNWPNNSSVSWSVEDLNIVAFIQRDGSGESNKKVFQVEALAFD
tara:strand:- start:581 stop:1462 length:882 start_codon:yes stop_codon:yes gene_type:complete